MTQSDIQTIIGAIFLLILTGIFILQIHRMWKIRTIMKNFLNELRTLNENLNAIANCIHGKSGIKENTWSSRTICKYCLFRQTFIIPDSPKVFFYQCKLDKRKISLKYTCKRFQKDLLNTQI